jgi:CBS domain-containing protein
MTRRVITASPDSPLHEIASLLENNSIKRVPIVKDGQVVGIVSRANLIQAVASGRKELDIPVSDTIIRDKLLANLKAEAWAYTGLLNITVNGGIVDLWGITGSDAERKAIRIAAESVPGVNAVHDNLIRRPMEAWT